MHVRASFSLSNYLAVQFSLICCYLTFDYISNGGECYSFIKNKYASNRIVQTKYGPLQGVIFPDFQVEAFLGVPYATPPLESLRYMPPVIPSIWTKTRKADTFSSVCPQRLPDITNRTEALLQIPRGRLVFLEKLIPILSNQSEDCLYLNIYVPRATDSNVGLIPTILFIHGESYEWNAGNVYDGSILANYGNVIVVTINYRLGILGFLKTGNIDSAQGNYGLMDIIAGLHWLKENLSVFGGDPDRITVMGHSTGAALANFIAVSPVTRELLQRVILLSGSGLSPWALQRNPIMIKRKVAEHTGCHGDLYQDDMAPCLRLKKLSELLNVQIDPPRFLPGFAPFVDGTVISHSLKDNMIVADILSLSKSKKGHGFELSDFPDRDLLFGVTSLESYSDFCAQDLEFGFSESKRDRVLRTFVRNCYYFHLNELFSTIKNEYTDWERSTQNLLSVRDSTLDILSDGHTVSYLLKIGYLHSIRGGRTFFFHFSHSLNIEEFPQKSGSIRGDDLPFIFGFPLHGIQSFFNRNYTQEEVRLCKQTMRYISNFARKGNPNGLSVNEQETGIAFPHWDHYDSVNQQYLELSSKSAVKSHYRGHKISTWLNLIPQLHQPGLGEFNMQHHHFQEEATQFYDGLVRPQSYYSNNVPTVVVPSVLPSTTTSEPTTAPLHTNISHQKLTTECANVSLNAAADTARTQNDGYRKNKIEGFLDAIADHQYQNYAIALIATISVGCFLLLLNIFMFAGIYRQRGSTLKNKSKYRNSAATCEKLVDYDGNQFNINSADSKFLHQVPVRLCKSSLSANAGNDLPLKHREFFPIDQHITAKSSATNCASNLELEYYVSDSDTADENAVSNVNGEGEVNISLPIPEPPPPPKHLPPPEFQTPQKYSNPQSIIPPTKKRVQIQEISV